MYEDKSSLLCRLCLKSGDCPIDIFDPKGTNGLLVWEIIKEFTEIETCRSDGLPPTICEDCMKKLTDFKYFKKMCIDSRMEFLFHKINDGLVVPIKMEEVDLNEQTENLLPNSTWESKEDEHSELADVESQFHVKNEENNEEIPSPEDYLSNSGEKVSSEEVRYSDVYGSASEMHVEHEEVAKEMHPLVEYTSTIDGESFVEEMQSSGVHGSASEVTLNGEKMMDQDDLCLHLSSRGSEEGSDVKECSLIVTGPEAKVTSVTYTDEPSVPVDGGGERVENLEETLISEKGPNRLEGTGHQGLARKQHCAMVPGATHSPFRQRSSRSNSRNEKYGPNEGIQSTPCSTSGKKFGERNRERAERKEETRRGSKHGNDALAGNISIGSSVGDEKSERQDFMCDGCGQVFRSKDLIERHVNVPCGRELINCGICSTKFHNRNDYRRHRSLHCRHNISRRRVQSGVALDVRGKSDGKMQIKKRILYTCHVCSKEFSGKWNLKVHIKTVHVKEQNFSCEICGKGFGLKQTLQTHIRYHNGVKPYTCSHCHKDFTESGNLRQHIRAVHEMEKPHTCGECGKTFSQKPHLKRHMIIHTGERPHTCGICSRSFSHKHHLESHMLMHTGEKPHTCTLCSKTFRQNRSLKHHMATHARNVPHPCNLCTKTFAFRSELQRHLAEHRGGGE